eukprot:CAMPEP_0194029374 /NCGR_PEP_ID=MMETSP0009_2-20130614/3107_1 /TAXON_ID=210454 /ORGANISM="Grammatophora oceanica, Strain CCMP 410" /LENGTH=456 /DNA_ID=CAMNT_0038669015 /DNA_START=154 /DNA_END=1525 /DNA_ORIENTATION=+
MGRYPSPKPEPNSTSNRTKNSVHDEWDDEKAAEQEEDQQGFRHKQEFVNVRFDPGQWDRKRRDPLHRPPWKNSARIISAEDFAERPRVGFSSEFASLYDAMMTFSHMTADDDDKVYGDYLELMIKSHKQNKDQVTSHEYVCRVLAQKYNITANRVAATIQLKHNEEQHKKKGYPLLSSTQEYVDSKTLEHIKEAYAAYGETPPGQFVENPVGVDGMGTGEKSLDDQFDELDDLVDVEAMEEQRRKNEKGMAQTYIDKKQYQVDVDESLKFVGLSENARNVLNRQKHFSKMKEFQRPPAWKPTRRPNEDGERKRRKRYKYIAKIVDTREDKKARVKTGKPWASAQARLDDTLVEIDGEVRAASLAEAKGTSWKPKRNVLEFMLRDVKKAWLDRVLRGEQGGWGRQDAPLKEQEEYRSEEAPPEDSEEVSEADNNMDGKDGEPSEDDTEGDGSKSDKE